MSKFQTEHYNKAIEEDTKTSSDDNKRSIYTSSQQASLMVFPDGSYGSNGFKKYVKQKDEERKSIAGKTDKSTSSSFTLTNELIDSIVGDTKDEPLTDIIINIRLENLKKYSIKYSYIIQSILNSKNQCCFVYSKFVVGSGIIVFSKLLDLFGFSKASGNETKTSLRYGLLTRYNDHQISKIINRFNQPNNIYGDYIKVLIGTPIISEGFSFFHIQQEYILTPWFNYSETDQAIARGIRFGSHRYLIEQGVNPYVNITQLVALPDSKIKTNTLSIDLYMYELSEDKDITIRHILRLLMEAAFDCSLNYYRNHIKDNDKDGTRLCEYQQCDYVCDGINMKNIEEGLTVDEIDYSTYQLYYSDPQVNIIRKDLVKFFKKHNELDIKSIINYFDGKYTEKAILNALRIIIDKSNEKLYYKDFINIYSRSNVNKIINGIVLLFQKTFELSFDDIKNNFPSYTLFEVLTSLKNIIDESIIIQNKYGFPSYLREENNIYYLVDNLTISDDKFSGYYTKIPTILVNKTFKDILYDTQLKYLPDIIDMLCNVNTEKEFDSLINHIPLKVQEMFIEAVIHAEKQQINDKQFIINSIKKYFSAYINIIDEEKVIISTLLKETKNILRCYTNGIWNNCDKKYEEILYKKNKEIKNKLEQYDYYGKYNPTNKVFSIVNITEQKEKEATELNNKKKNLDILVKKGKITEKERDIEMDKKDSRNIFTGKNCRKGWGVPKLLDLVINIFKIEYPSDFMNSDSKETLRSLVRKNKYLNKMYSDDDINNLNKNSLRRALFWVIKPKGGYLDSLCDIIEKWLRERELIVDDKEIGTKGGHKKKEESEEKEIDFNVDLIIPSEIPTFKTVTFEKYLKLIEKLNCEEINIKELQNERWVIILLKRTLIGFFILDNTNNIIHICFNNKYVKKGMTSNAIQYALKQLKIDSIKIILDNKIKHYDKYIKLYTDYGLNILMNDDISTTLEFKI